MSLKKVVIINGSASENSSNQLLIDNILEQTRPFFEIVVFRNLKSFPHFDPELSISNPPKVIRDFRCEIEKAAGVIFCTPEYVFSIPSGLKNALEWCVSTTVFSEKPVAVITASSSGVKGHEELKLILKTMMAKFNSDTTLLIQGVKGKINEQGEVIDNKTKIELEKFIEAFARLMGL